MAQSKPSTSIKPRDMTDLDYLTHDFMNSESFRRYCLDKYGQYFSNGKRYVKRA
jgi:hypothetical protein